MIHAFTSSAGNYGGKAKALFESLREHCPDFHLHWVVADRRQDAVIEAMPGDLVDEIIFATDLEPGKDPRWLFQHSIVELSTAIKPFAAIEILARDDCDQLLYFDPDMVVFSALDDLVAELEDASIVLTPHILHPRDEMEAILDQELCALRHGVFNLGFLGVTGCDEGQRFLRWWRDRCTTFCWGDWREGVFTDQKWMNFAPVFFPGTKILRNPRFNVAPWNVNGRQVEGSFDEGFEVGGEALGFFHFSGFDSGDHRVMVEKYAGSNRVPRMLADWYSRHTEALQRDVPPRWALGEYDNGRNVEALHRKIFRLRPDLQGEFPDPYATEGDGLTLYDWMRRSARVEHPDLFDDPLSRKA